MCLHSVGLQMTCILVLQTQWLDDENERELCVISCSISQSMSDHSVYPIMWTQIRCLGFQKYSGTNDACMQLP